jgi:hypothetical protein
MAYLGSVHWQGGITDEELADKFRQAPVAGYQALAAEVRDEMGRDSRASTARLAQFRRQLAEVSAADHFGVEGRKEVEEVINRLEGQIQRPAEKSGIPDDEAAQKLRGLTWVTRPDVYVDRIATAWLVRRFVDSHARFRFVADSGRRPRPGEITFDLVGGDITHQGSRCTFQVLLDRLRSHDTALRAIGEIVAEIDLKEARYGHAESALVERLLNGLVAAHARDGERLERGAEVFDALYAALSAERAGVPQAARKRGARRRRSGR